MGWCNDSLQSEDVGCVGSTQGCTGLIGVKALNGPKQSVGSPRMWVGVKTLNSPKQSVGSPRMWVGVKTLNSPRQSGW